MSALGDHFLKRIALALERLSPPPPPAPRFEEHAGFLWHAQGTYFEPVETINHLPLELILGVDRSRDILLENSKQFARGFMANNALLWGARGMGKSSLVKAVHAKLAPAFPELKLIEILREDLSSLSMMLQKLKSEPIRAIVLCDDLSFEGSDDQHKSLKAVLDGGIQGRPANVLFYATSNRRHLMPRQMIENEEGSAINPSEATEEKVSLSDRFGLWLGFHPCDQATYLSIIRGYCRHFGVEIDEDLFEREAIEWQKTRGARSGRTAWQYFCDLAGRRGVHLEI